MYPITEIVQRPRLTTPLTFCDLLDRQVIKLLVHLHDQLGLDDLYFLSAVYHDYLLQPRCVEAEATRLRRHPPDIAELPFVLFLNLNSFRAAFTSGGISTVACDLGCQQCPDACCGCYLLTILSVCVVCPFGSGQTSCLDLGGGDHRDSHPPTVSACVPWETKDASHRSQVLS
jgi:hypothetical protein